MQKKQKHIFIILAAILACSLLFSLLAPLFAARADTVSDLQSQLSEAQRSRQEAEAGLSSVKQEISDAESKRTALDQDISALETEIAQLSQQIETNETGIQTLTEELEDAEEKSTAYEDTFKERVRVMYERSDVSFLNILFGATSFSDLLKRVETVSRIVEYDKEVMAQMADAQAEIAAKTTALEDSNEAVKLSKQIHDSKKAELDASKSALYLVLADLESDEESYKKMLDDADAAEAALRDEIRALTQAKSTTPAPTSASQTTPAPQTKEPVVEDNGGAFCWPTPSTRYITSHFGTRYHPVQKRNKTHTGIDIGAGHGASILAAQSGTVLRAGWNSGYGNYVVIDHGGGVQPLYGHCSALLVSSGQSVSRGQQIALVGSTGVSTGPHLHFEVLINGSYTDPMGYF